MSALRINVGGEVRHVDLGPGQALSGESGFRGSLVVGQSGSRERDATAADRLRDWRKRHGLNGKQRLGDRA